MLTNPWPLAFGAHPHVIDELDEVVLTCDLPDHGLAAGDIETVVLVHGEGKGYEVERESSPSPVTIATPDSST